MPQLRKPTGTNRHAGADIQKKALAELRTVYAKALTPMHTLSKRSTITPAEVIDALRQLREASAQIETLQYTALGAAVLAGTEMGTVASRTGIAPRTLTRHLAHGPAALRGREVVWDPTSPHGWRPVA